MSGSTNFLMQERKNKYHLPSLAPHCLIDKSKFLTMASEALAMFWPLPKYPVSFSATNYVLLNTPETAFTSSKLYYFLAIMFSFMPLPLLCLENSYFTFKLQLRNLQQILPHNLLHKEFIFSAKLLQQVIYTFIIVFIKLILKFT